MLLRQLVDGPVLTQLTHTIAEFPALRSTGECRPRAPDAGGALHLHRSLWGP